jgi:hypothetical protein
MLPKEEQSKIYIAVQPVPKHLDKRGEEKFMTLPIQGVWITDQETFGIALPMYLLMFGVPGSCFEVAMIWCFK